MNEYSGLISISSLAVSVLSGLYLNSKIESLTQRVAGHEIQLQDIRTQLNETTKVGRQALDIAGKQGQDIVSLKDDVDAVAFQACGPEFITPSTELQMSSYNRRGYSARGRGRAVSSPRPAIVPSDITSQASMIH